MPVFSAPDDHRSMLLILLLLARDADLAPEQVDGPDARALVSRVLARRTRTGRARHWPCPRRRSSTDTPSTD